MMKVILLFVVLISTLSLLSACGYWGHGHWGGHGHRYSMSSSYSQFHDRDDSYS